MSFGKMNTFIDIIEKVTIKDSEGFSTEIDNIVATIRAYREGRHGTEMWANRATFSEATDLFRFRCIPGVTITTECLLRVKTDDLRLPQWRMSKAVECTLKYSPRR
jgi:head-tail adaptor